MNTGITLLDLRLINMLSAKKCFMMQVDQDHMELNVKIQVLLYNNKLVEATKQAAVARKPMD